MSVTSQDVCIVCSKTIRSCHKDITCTVCKMYVHKKCTKLKPKDLKKCAEWTCEKCKITNENLDDTVEVDIECESLINHYNVSEVDLESKFKDMRFNPSRFESIDKNEIINHHQYNNECSYSTPDRFESTMPLKKDTFTCLNVNIRSLSKKFDKLIRECSKATNHDFTVIGISETHLKGNPLEYYNLPGYKMEYVNRVGREKGGVCIYVNDKVKFKTRKDLWVANANFESCFIEIERQNAKNILVGVIYRAHTSIDDFTLDIEKVFNKTNSENKITYVMGDFNIDLLKDDTCRPVHDYIDFIYSKSLIPTIYKPTRITETTATLIDKILSNCENVQKSAIIITDISDHMATSLVSNLSLRANITHKRNVYYKRCHSDDNISMFKQRLSNVRWGEVLDDIDVNQDYNTFVTKFQELYDECIPLKKCTSKR